MIIAIDPLDTVVFRDAKPFSKADDTWTTSLRFPTPSTIYGALRTAYFSQNPEQFKDLYDNNNDKTKNLIIKGIYLYYNNEEILYVVPKDCAKRKDCAKESDKNKLITLQLQPNQLTSSPLAYNLFSEQLIESTGDIFLDDITFDDYLQNKTNLSYKNLDELMSVDNKIGLGINNTKRVAEEGLLYSIQMLRYEFKILVEFEGITLADKGLMKFGGEAKGANYQKIENIERPYQANIQNKRFKLYLLTPTIFNKGWFPDWIDESNNFEGEFEGIKLKLLSCALAQYQTLGGFDIKKNEPKQTLRVVPAGSVYYFEVLDEQQDKLFDAFQHSISEQKSEEGFGLVILSEVKP